MHSILVTVAFTLLELGGSVLKGDTLITMLVLLAVYHYVAETVFLT